MPPRLEGQLADALLETSADACLGVDRAGVIRLFNPQAARLFGLKASEVIGRTLWEALPLDEFTRALSLQVKGSDPAPIEQVMVLGEDRVFAVQMSAVRTDRGRNLGAVATLKDMAGVQKIERGLDQFLVDVTRRISVPLTSIKGFVETLLEGPYGDPDITRRFLQIINEETNRLVRLVMTLEQSCQAGEAPSPRRDRVALGALLEGVCAMFLEVAAQKGVSLAVEPWSEPVHTVGDAEALRRMVVNLVDNAIRYTGVKGGGQVSLGVRQEPGGRFLTVRDTGVGVPLAEQGRIFERFHRVDEGPAAGLGGTGLGLSVAREIARAHGGEIAVESLLGEGSTFTVRLPGP